MSQFSTSPFEMFSCLWRNRKLILIFAKREVLARYRGSVLGLLWSFFNPLFMLMVYTFVFSEVFKSRWQVASESKTEFALLIYVGLIVFNLFSECTNRAPGLVLTNPNYVKKVIFPLEILPIISLFSGLYHALISMTVWIAAYSILYGMPNANILLLPAVILPFCFLIMGLSWALSSLGIFFRDVSQFVGIVTTTLMFLSPTFYPVSALPESYRNLLYLNPLTPFIEITRDILYWGLAPDINVLFTLWLETVFISWIGFAWFQKTRKGFADVL